MCECVSVCASQPQDNKLTQLDYPLLLPSLFPNEVYAACNLTFLIILKLQIYILCECVCARCCCSLINTKVYRHEGGKYIALRQLAMDFILIPQFGLSCCRRKLLLARGFLWISMNSFGYPKTKTSLTLVNCVLSTFE